MTKPRQSYSGTDMRLPICTKQVACDGDNLNVASRERGYCGKCAEAMKRRSKTPPPLRGENTALSMETRRMELFKKRREGKE
jgi:hypothetical protein